MAKQLVRLFTLLAAGYAIQGPAAQANSIYTWSSQIGGVAVSGSADFSTYAGAAGYDLTIVLTNTSDNAPTSSATILSGLYFDITSTIGQGALGMQSAVATGGLIQPRYLHQAAAGTAGTNICAPGTGGTALSPSCTAQVAGGWEAAYFAAGFGDSNDHYGIGTTGQSGVFQGNSSKAGQADYAIAPGDGVGLSSGANASLTNHFPYTYGTATFVLTGLTTNNIAISNVFAAYGTAPEGTPGSSVPEAEAPEPGTIIEFGAGLLLVALGYRRRKRAQ